MDYQALRALNWEQGTLNSKKKPARILGLEQVNLFMKKIKTFFSSSRRIAFRVSPWEKKKYVLVQIP
jgi:hypothetical protein